MVGPRQLKQLMVRRQQHLGSAATVIQRSWLRWIAARNAARVASEARVYAALTNLVSELQQQPLLLSTRNEGDVKGHEESIFLDGATFVQKAQQALGRSGGSGGSGIGSIQRPQPPPRQLESKRLRWCGPQISNTSKGGISFPTRPPKVPISLSLSTSHYWEGNGDDGGSNVFS